MTHVKPLLKDKKQPKWSKPKGVFSRNYQAVLSPNGEVEAYLVPKEHLESLLHKLHILKTFRERENDTWIPFSEVEEQLYNKLKKNGLPSDSGK